MIHRRWAALAATILFLSPLALRADTVLTYPPAARGDVVDDYFGTKVADPYRWMEEIDSPQTKAWVAAEAGLTDSYLAPLPYRAALRDRLTALYDYERVSAPSHEGATYLSTRNTGLQNQSVLYVAHGEHGVQHVLLDPNTLSSDGTVALGGGRLSHDGKFYAYSTQTSGSDWQTWHVRDVASGKDLADSISWAKFSGATWSHDNSGFYYAAYDPPSDATKLNIVNRNQKVYFHKLGTPQSSDALVYARPDHPEWFLGASETDDGRYLIYDTSKGENNGLLYRALGTAAKTDPIELFPNEKARYDLVDSDGPIFYVHTNDGAPNGKLIAVDVRAPAKAKVVIPETSIALLGVSAVGKTFFASYLKDARSQIVQFGRDGRRLGEVVLPGIGSAGGFGGHHDDKTTYYSFSSFAVPATSYRYDLATGKSTVYARPHVKFDPSLYVTEQIFFKNKDGTRVPMFVSYKRGTRHDGTTPALLTGYGGFDIATRPGFSPTNLLWMEMGGVFASANMRGGSEYGEAWHHAGMLANKQHVFDDFIAAAEWLVAHKYTSTPKLAIHGGSNGGLLMGAVENQRPDLFGAVLADVGVMDMLRYQKFTVGAAWIPEYGSSEASAAQFATLYAYSPLDNLKAGTKYPPTIISTADHDDRVFPAHSFKYAAEMQRDQAGPAPILLFVELKAGHGGGKPLKKIIDENAAKYAFLAASLHFTPQIP
jgi:prolyl oligopeptidase